MALTEYLNLGNGNILETEIERIQIHIRTKPIEKQCFKCGQDLKFYYSEHERIITLLDYDLHVVNEVHKCINPECKKRDGKWLTYKSSEAAALTLPKHRYGIDVLLKIGKLRFEDHYKIQRIMEHLYKHHRIQIREAEVYRYQLKYLELFKGFQGKKKRKIKKQLHEQGGWILAIDGTRSNKSKTLYIARDEISSISLDAQILGKGNPEDIEKFVSSLIESYGMPNAVISDAEGGLFSTLKKLLPGIPVQYCQRQKVFLISPLLIFHFLRK
ncbi:MAG: hypothetical protein ACTSO2_19300 [Promethearchaeota archaeon]